MASLSDLLTAAQNIVQAINGVAQTYLAVQGIKNVPDISSAMLAKSSAGRVATVVVTTAGSATGLIYDSTSTTAPTFKVFVIPMTVGVYVVNMPVGYGIVVAPGAGQVVTVSYS